MHEWMRVSVSQYFIFIKFNEIISIRYELMSKVDSIVFILQTYRNVFLLLLVYFVLSYKRICYAL